MQVVRSRHYSMTILKSNYGLDGHAKFCVGNGSGSLAPEEKSNRPQSKLGLRSFCCG